MQSPESSSTLIYNPNMLSAAALCFQDFFNEAETFTSKSEASR
jgi:hypothetical protein